MADAAAGEAVKDPRARLRRLYEVHHSSAVLCGDARGGLRLAGGFLRWVLPLLAVEASCVAGAYGAVEEVMDPARGQCWSYPC